MKQNNENYRFLSKEERLIRHQLNIAYYWQDKCSPVDNLASKSVKNEKQYLMPEKWELLKEINLHDWQIDCIDKWFENGKNGVVKVVTGAGKTFVALGIAQKLQNEYNSDLRMMIVVPTIVLMGQWYDEILRYSNIPQGAIGRLGGGFSDGLSDEKRILISVLASAYKLSKSNKNYTGKGGLFFVVDECHRAGAEKLSKIFKIDREYSLGLSATPERDDTTDDNEEESVNEKEDINLNFEYTTLGRELGPIIYELTFAQAVARGILPKFQIKHYGLPLDPKERTEYEKLSRDISDLRISLQQSSKYAGTLDGGRLVGWARKVASRSNARMSDKAAEYVRKVGLRKRLLYRAKARTHAVVKILKEEFGSNPNARAILFHESVPEVMRLFQVLRSDGFSVVCENYQLTDKIRAESIELFRNGVAKIMISARSLIEGFDVPAADVGIVVASSSSVRQRIQTLGRILRKQSDPVYGDKFAVLHVLYMSRTVDEMIYEKNDWSEVIGAERNQYFLWDPPVQKEPIAKPSPPRVPLPTEEEIDWENLEIGSQYLGRYEGKEYRCDSKGNVTDEDENMISNPQDIEKRIFASKGSYGKFRVTPRKNGVLVNVFEDGKWMTKFAGYIEQPFQIITDMAYANQKPIDITKAQPGDIYTMAVGDADEYRLKRRAHGAVIAKKVKGGEIYALTGDNAEDIRKGKDAEMLIEAVQKASPKENGWISKVLINHKGHAIYYSKGQPRLLCVLQNGLEFPSKG